MRVPVRRKLDPDLEVVQLPRWFITNELRPAFVRASTLNADTAAQILANLPNGEAPDHFRTSLLLYYVHQGATDVQKALQARRDLLTWLIRTFPQDAILSSPYAIINATGEPLADSEGAYSVKKEWLAAVQQYPNDLSVAVGASNFLRTTEPLAALRLVAEKKNWDIQNNYLGDLYARAGLGVNVISPSDGAALATVFHKVSDGDVAASFRKALLDATDLKTVLAGVVATREISRQLSAHRALPEGYDAYCQALMNHLRQLYPETSLNCASPGFGAPPDPPLTRAINASVAKSNLIQHVEPVYPPEAKKKHAAGALEFNAIIDTQGHVQRLELIRGPFVLYDAACNAIRQWRYRPVLANGVPLQVSTEIVVDFPAKH